MCLSPSLYIKKILYSVLSLGLWASVCALRRFGIIIIVSRTGRTGCRSGRSGPDRHFLARIGGGPHGGPVRTVSFWRADWRISCEL